MAADLKPEKAKRFVDSEMVKVVDENDVLQEGFLKSIVDYILQRTRFRYGYQEILHYITHCRFFKRMRKNKKNPLGSMDKRHLLYKKGNEKLERELDVVNLVKSIRQLRLMSQVLLGPNERMLLKF